MHHVSIVDPFGHFAQKHMMSDVVKIRLEVNVDTLCFPMQRLNMGFGEFLGIYRINVYRINEFCRGVTISSLESIKSLFLMR